MSGYSCPECGESVHLAKMPTGRMICITCNQRKLAIQDAATNARMAEAAERTTRDAVWWRKPFVWLAWRLIKPFGWLLGRLQLL